MSRRRRSTSSSTSTDSRSGSGGSCGNPNLTELQENLIALIVCINQLSPFGWPMRRESRCDGTFPVSGLCSRRFFCRRASLSCEGLQVLCRADVAMEFLHAILSKCNALLWTSTTSCPSAAGCSACTPNNWLHGSLHARSTQKVWQHTSLL